MSLIEWAHLGGFGFGCVGCLLACWRARLVSDRETRYGLCGLLLTSGLWAGSYLLTFLTPSLTVATVACQVGLICGLATVGAWLYFCSAYTGQGYHRRPAYRRLALGVFVAISSLKLTNQVHGLYYEIEIVETPFRHASVTLLGLHWAVATVAYALSAIGFYMLFRLFRRSRVPTVGLTVLVGLMASPVVLNALGFLGVPGLVVENYEPLGVAAFALGTLYVAGDTFERVRWTGHQGVFDKLDEAILFLDSEREVYQFNTAAEALFPDIEAGRPVEALLSDLESVSDDGAVPSSVDDSRLVRPEGDGPARYYLLRETELTLGPHQVGLAVILTDVTQIERQRRELERQSDQLEGFAAAVAHEIRNSLTIIEGSTALLAESVDGGEVRATTDYIGRISDATRQMSDVTDDLVTIGRLSQPVRDPQTVSFQTAVREALEAADTGDLAVTVTGEGEIRVEETRFSELVRNVVRLARETDAAELEMCLTDAGFTVRMDGDSLADSDTEALLEYGTAVPHADAGMLGPNINSLSRAHGWEVTVRPPEDGGIALAFSGATSE